jgi:hypothetical protein
VTHPSRALGVLAGAAALIITGMSPASASIWRHDDAVGDVHSQTDIIDEETGEFIEGEFVIAPENTDTDVSRIRVSHRTHRISLRTTLRDITRRSGFLVYDVRTDGRRYSVMQRLGKDRLFPAFDLSRANGGRVKCAGLTRTVDRATNRATVSIPRRCLGRPDWVRIGAGAAKIDITDTSVSVLVDDALRDALVLDTLGLSPRIERG